jgi:diguanylate cyclase (GGDEF)-like protein
VTPLAPGNNALRRAFNEGTTWKGEMVIAPAGGQKIRVMATASPLRDPSGEQVGAVTTMHDITLMHQRESALHRVEQQLAEVALHDRLTGAPNRTLFADRLAKTLARTGRSGHQLAVLFCDLDGFAAVNDNGGQNAGDAVLEATAKRLVAILRAEDTAARVGADEFVVILEPSSRVWTGPDGEPIDVRAYAVEVAERIEAALAVPVDFDGHEYAVTVSIGLAFAQAGDDGEKVVAEAEAAMYCAKSLGKNRHEIAV